MIKLEAINVDIKDLLLDPNNPRFLRHKEERVVEKNIELVQEKTYQTMINTGFDVQQLADTIKEDGYLGFDRIFVQKKGDKYLVREGNRRISAVKLLLEKSVDGTKANALSADILQSFKVIPAIDVSNLTEQEIQQMLGRRHFDSVKDWKTLP